MIHGDQPDRTAMCCSLEIYTEAGERLRTDESVAELAGCTVPTRDANVRWGQMPASLGTVGRTQVWSSTVADAWLDPARDRVPAELRALRRWTRRDHKRPLMNNGEPAWVMDPQRWTTYAKAKASSTGDGLGFVLDDDQIVGLNLHHGVTDDGLTAGAQAISTCCTTPTPRRHSQVMRTPVLPRHRLEGSPVQLARGSDSGLRYRAGSGRHREPHPGSASVLADHDDVGPRHV